LLHYLFIIWGSFWTILYVIYLVNGICCRATSNSDIRIRLHDETATGWFKK